MKMMSKQYQSPEMKLLLISGEDIVTASNVTDAVGDHVYDFYD